MPLVTDTAITLLIFLAGTALGKRLLARFALPDADRVERGLFAAALGVGLLAYVPFALFAVGGGRPSVVAGNVIVLMAFVRREVFAVLRGAAKTAREGLRNGRDPALRPLLPLLLGVAPLLAIVFLQAACPPTDPDGLHYHLTAPLAYLARQRFYYMPTFLHVHWPLGVEMLFGIGMAFRRDYAAGLIQFGFGLLTLVATFALGRRIANASVGWLAAGLALIAFRGELPTAYVDLGVAFYTLTAVYAWFLGWQFGQAGGTRHSYFTLSALLAGLAATAKLPGIFTVLTLAGMTFFAVKNWARMPDFRGGASAALAYVGIGLLVAAPWYVRSLALTGSPLYPYLGAVFPIRDWSPEWQARLTEYFQAFNTFRSRRLDFQQVKQLRGAVCVFLLGIGLVANGIKTARHVRPLLLFLWISAFLQVAASGIYGRYFLYLAPLAALLPLWTLRGAVARAPGRVWILSLGVALLLWGGPRFLSRWKTEIANARSALSAALGTESRDAYLTRRLPIYPTLRWANANLPPNATVALGVLDSYASLLRRDSLDTTYWTQNSLRYDSYPEMLADLRRLRATHLILRDAPPPTAAELAGMDRELRVRQKTEFLLLRRLAAQYGHSILRRNGYTLYALRLPPA